MYTVCLKTTNGALSPRLIRLAIRKKPQKPAVLHLYPEEHQYHSCIMWDFCKEAFKPTLNPCCTHLHVLKEEEKCGVFFVFFFKRPSNHFPHYGRWTVRTCGSQLVFCIKESVNCNNVQQIRNEKSLKNYKKQTNKQFPGVQNRWQTTAKMLTNVQTTVISWLADRP